MISGCKVINNFGHGYLAYDLTERSRDYDRLVNQGRLQLANIVGYVTVAPLTQEVRDFFIQLRNELTWR